MRPALLPALSALYCRRRSFAATPRAPCADVGVRDLARLLACMHEEAQGVRKLLDAALVSSGARAAGGGAGSFTAQARSALEILEQQPAIHSIVTFSKHLDEVLGGGIPLGQVTELCECAAAVRDRSVAPLPAYIRARPSMAPHPTAPSRRPTQSAAALHAPRLLPVSHCCPSHPIPSPYVPSLLPYRICHCLR